MITQIYKEVNALSPKPQFVVTTGDYVFAYPSGTQGEAQLNLYTGAMANYTGGPVFASLGNHECTGATASNCANAFNNKTYDAFLAKLVAPLGKTLPYYSVPFRDPGSSWTAKMVLVACNAWDTTQKNWLQAELARNTTYTIVVRHEQLGTAAPCTTEADALIAQYPVDLILVGHAHTFSRYGKQVIVGNGGAPIGGSTPFGFATVEMMPGVGWRVTQYDYATALPINAFIIP